MRSPLVLGISALVALACGGGAPRMPRDTGRVMPVVRDTAALGTAEPAPGPSPPPEAGAAQQVRFFAATDAGCVWQELDPASPTTPRPLATLRGGCPEEYVLVPSADASKVVVTAGGEATEIDLAAGTVTAVPPLPFDSGVFGYDAAGRLVAIQSVGGYEVTLDAPGEQAWYQVDGERLEADYWSEAEGMGSELCFAWRHDGTEWKRVDTEVVGLAEGMGPPFCVLESRLSERFARPMIDPRENGGHGEWFPEVAHGAEQLPPLEWEVWKSLSGDGWSLAFPVENLEGESIATPLYVWVDGFWKPVPEMADRSWMSLHTSGHHGIGCQREGVGLFDLRTGEPLWTAKGPCPVWWPPAP